MMKLASWVIRAARKEESGVAMMIAVVLLTVITTLTVMSLTVATHVNKSTGSSEHRAQALQVAESGVEQALARIEANAGAYTGTFTGQTEEGPFRVTVTRLGRNTYTIDSTGGARSSYVGGVWVDRELGAHRRIQVTIAPPRSFSNALFSFTTLNLKNNDVVTGDVWANQNLVMDANTSVTGSVTAATGYAELDGPVGANVRTGGFKPSNGRAVDSTSSVGGTITASVVDPPDPITCGGADQSSYKVNITGHVSAGITTWGTKTGSGTYSGTYAPHTCTSAPATLPMPSYTYNANNYDAATLYEYGTPTVPSATAVSDFHAYLASHLNDMRGTFYVNQSGAVSQSNRLDLSNMRITGDLTIVTNTPVYSAATGDNGSDAIVLIASTYDPAPGTSCEVNHDNSDCAIHAKNQFSVSGTTAVLLYAPYGPVAVKNNAKQFGAIYADSMEIKNNQEMTYDLRVDRIVGFGPVTLEPTKWVELNDA